MNVLYDAGLLVKAEGNERHTWADHRSRLELGVVPLTTAPVVAQVSRSSRQVPLRRFLRGCRIEPFLPEQAHRVGELLGTTRTSDVVDAHVAVLASEQGAVVLTSDPTDLKRLGRELSPRPEVRPI